MEDTWKRIVAENGVKERRMDSTGESLDNAWVLRLDDGETACSTWHVESVGGGRLSKKVKV